MPQAPAKGKSLKEAKKRGLEVGRKEHTGENSLQLPYSSYSSNFLYPSCSAPGDNAAAGYPVKLKLGAI